MATNHDNHHTYTYCIIGATLSDPLQCHDSCFDLLPASYTYIYINMIDAFIMTPHRLSTLTPKCHAFTWCSMIYANEML